MYTITSQTKGATEDVGSASFEQTLRQRANELVGGKVSTRAPEIYARFTF